MLITEEEFQKEKELLMEELNVANGNKTELGIEELITFLIEKLVTLRVQSKKLASVFDKIEPF